MSGEYVPLSRVDDAETAAKAAEWVIERLPRLADSKVGLSEALLALRPCKQAVQDAVMKWNTGAVTDSNHAVVSFVTVEVLMGVVREQHKRLMILNPEPEIEPVYVPQEAAAALIESDEPIPAGDGVCPVGDDDCYRGWIENANGMRKCGCGRACKGSS